jgi:peroxiredoxin Q/BCP
MKAMKLKLPAHVMSGTALVAMVFLKWYGFADQGPQGPIKEVPMPSVGDKAPDFKLKDDSGIDISLKDFKGKTVVLYFYPKDDTPGCTTEACSFRDDLKAFSAKGAVVLGVSADSIESHGKFKQKYGLPFPLLSDPDKTAIQAYGVWKEKSMYGKTYMGIERTTFIIGPDGKIKKIFPKVSVTGHSAAVLDAIK